MGSGPRDWQEEIFWWKGFKRSCSCAGLDACLLHEEDSDPDAYLFPLPLIDEGDDSPEDSRQVLVDTRAARSVFPSTFRPDVPIEPSKEIPLHRADGTKVAHFGSKCPSVGVSSQKIEGTLDVRNVTKPTVAPGQVTDEGEGVWLSGNGGYILDMRSAKKIERLLGDKSSFIELKKQKGVYVIPCDDRSSSLFPLVEKKSNSQARWTKVTVEVEEDRPARVKGAPVLPSEKDRDEHEVTHATFRSWCEACVAGRMQRKIRSSETNRVLAHVLT